MFLFQTYIEIEVESTKVYTTQLMTFYMIDLAMTKEAITEEYFDMIDKLKEMQ